MRFLGRHPGIAARARHEMKIMVRNLRFVMQLEQPEDQGKNDKQRIQEWKM
jgi:hypothetical protein